MTGRSSSLQSRRRLYKSRLSLLFLSLAFLLISPRLSRASSFGENRNAHSSSYSDTIPLKTHGWRIHEEGLSTGYGYGINRFNLPEGVYSPLFLIADIGVSFPGLDARNTRKRAHFSLLFEPQFNLVFLRGPENTKLNYEGGIGVGLQEMISISPRFFPFIRLVAGPHYFNTVTSLQHKGFLFSDNVAGGFYYFLSKKWAVQAQYRARHMSNANLALPNHGINTSNFLIGLSHFL